MSPYDYSRGVLACDGLSLEKIAAQAGTPFYCYSAREIRARFRRLARAFAALDPLICYSVKANGNLSVLRLLAKEGCAFDIVSEGELFRVKKAGCRSEKIVFAGVGKTDEEIEAALRAKVFLFNVESEEEMLRIDAMAGRLRLKTRIALRVNPDVDPKTHKYITTGKRENKFGVDLDKARAILRRGRRLRSVRLAGLHAHIGSQIVQARPYLQALDRLSTLFSEFPGAKPELVDLGGGFGISYQGGEGMDVEALAAQIVPKIKKWGVRLLLEPGRFLVASSGALVTKVVVTKKSGSRLFAICDAGMSELIRPSLYEAYHRILPVRPRRGKVLADVVGPICESGDFFALDRSLPPIKAGDLLAVLDAGAYGFAMSSHYNARPNVPELLVENGRARVIRRRERFADLVRGEA